MTASGCSAANVPVVEMMSKTRMPMASCSDPGHHQIAAVGDHLVHRAAERARHGHRARVQRSHRSRAALRLDQLHRGGVHPEMLKHAQQLEVGHVAQRRVDLLTRQRLRRVARGDPQIRIGHTVVGIRVAHRHTHQQQVRPARHEVRERRQTLRIGDVDVAGLHRLSHVAARSERDPVHRQTQSFVIGLLGLGHLIRRRPLQEVRHIQLIEHHLGIVSGRSGGFVGGRSLAGFRFAGFRRRLGRLVVAAAGGDEGQAPMSTASSRFILFPPC